MTSENCTNVILTSVYKFGDIMFHVWLRVDFSVSWNKFALNHLAACFKKHFKTRKPSLSLWVKLIKNRWSKFYSWLHQISVRNLENSSVSLVCSHAETSPVAFPDVGSIPFFSIKRCFKLRGLPFPTEMILTI